METNFYKFSQNNTGGSFITNDKLCHILFIEANSESEAEDTAIGLGVYFDGVYSGDDCPCCGDRWYSPEVLEFPKKWNEEITFYSIEEYAQHLADRYGWTSPDGRIFYLDGRIIDVFSNK